MLRLTFIAHDGWTSTIEARTGLSVMENAVANGIEGIVAVCGGNAYCGTCRVYVAPEWQARTGAQTDIEGPMLETVGDGDPALRLSCQIPFTDDLDGLIVRLPETQE